MPFGFVAQSSRRSRDRPTERLYGPREATLLVRSLAYNETRSGLIFYEVRTVQTSLFLRTAKIDAQKNNKKQ